MFKKKIDASFAGPEWAGEYTVEVIYAPESLKMYSEAQKELKLLKYSAKKDGKPLPDRIPHKLYELLAPEAHKLNTIMLEAGQELFLQHISADRRQKKRS